MAAVCACPVTTVARLSCWAVPTNVGRRRPHSSGPLPPVGMRVIGVTTTLDPATMTSAAPDWIVPDVRSVTVASLLGLQLSQARQSQQQQVEQQGQQEQQALGGSHGWLDGMVDLPAGYSTTRRDLLKIASLGGAFASLYVGLSRAQVGTASTAAARAAGSSCSNGAQCGCPCSAIRRCETCCCNTTFRPWFSWQSLRMLPLAGSTLARCLPSPLHSLSSRLAQQPGSPLGGRKQVAMPLA